MDPSAGLFSTLLELLDRYGLPMSGLLLFGFTLWKGIFVRGAELKARDEQHAHEVEEWKAGVAYREQLRLEERAGRLEAERRLKEALEVAAAATDLTSKYEALVRERVNDK